MHFRDMLNSSGVRLKLSVVLKTTSACGVDKMPTELALAVMTWELAGQAVFIHHVLFVVVLAICFFTFARV